MNTEAASRKPLEVRATPEQHRILAEAAAREHRSLDSFVLDAALKAPQAESSPPRRSQEEIRAIVEAAQAAFREANPTGRDPLEELRAERREAAACE